MGKLNLSFSRINDYLTCPQLFYFKHILKLPTKPNPYLSLGLSVHKTLEKYFLTKASPEAIFDLYEQNWMNAGFSDEEEEERWKTNGKKMLENFIHFEQKWEGVPVAIEKKFVLRFEDYDIYGFIDRIDRLPDGRSIIIDYKTGARVEEALKQDLQLRIYSLGFRNLFNKLPDLAGKLFLKYELFNTTSYTNEDLVSALITIDAVAYGIAEKHFSPRPDEYRCNYCDFKDRCPFFKK